MTIPQCIRCGQSDHPLHFCGQAEAMAKMAPAVRKAVEHTRGGIPPQCARCGDIDVPGHVCADVLAWIAAAPAAATCPCCGQNIILPTPAKDANIAAAPPPSGYMSREKML